MTACPWMVKHRPRLIGSHDIPGSRMEPGRTEQCDEAATIRLTHLMSRSMITVTVCARHVRRYTSRIGAFKVEYLGGHKRRPKVVRELEELAITRMQATTGTIPATVPRHEGGSR